MILKSCQNKKQEEAEKAEAEEENNSRKEHSDMREAKSASLAQIV